MADIKDFKHAIVRQKILDAVRKDLIGPTSDCEQLNEVPTSSYITGLLFNAVFICIECYTEQTWFNG